MKETMKPIPYIILFLILGFGFYLNTLDPDKKTTNQEVLIEDSVGTSMAAPVKR